MIIITIIITIFIVIIVNIITDFLVDTCAKQQGCFTYTFDECDEQNRKEACMVYTRGENCVKNDEPINHVCEINSELTPG